MSTKLRHFPVNWEDGMKISKKHFIESENSWMDSIRDACYLQLNDFNYGLLPEQGINGNSVHVEVTSERIEVSKCRAITRGGLRIEVADVEISALHKPMSELMGDRDFQNNTEWFVVLKVNPFERQPVGEPDAEEQPLRQPHVLPNYTLEIVSGEMIGSDQFMVAALPIAKITNSYSQGRGADMLYIPPCTRVNSHHLLLEKHKEYSHQILQLDGHLFEIIKKIQHKKHSNILSQDIHQIVLALTQFINTHIDTYRMIVPQQAPIYLVEWFVKMARCLKSNMRFLHNEQGMLNYFDTYVKNANQKSLMVALDAVCTIQYKHLDVQKSLEPINHLMSFLCDFFNQLKEWNFEDDRTSTIVKHSTYTSTPTKKKNGGINFFSKKNKEAKGLGDTVT